MKWPWAVGGGDFVLPDHVGMPIGEGKRWLVLQVHYYNPNLDKGITDASGVRAYVTTDLREEEAGVLELDGGTDGWQRSPLPSGEAEHSLAPFIIPHECTAAIWNQPLNIIGVIHHIHLYGEEMKITVERDGLNLGVMRSERHYDFNHQSLEEPDVGLKQLLPGDQITMDCLYDTTKASDSVTFGDLTQQEMCYGAIVYYPRTDADSLGYLSPQGNATQCLSAATDDLFAENDLSLCAQELVDNVPRFFYFEDDVPAPFGALAMCNGGVIFDGLLRQLPGICPSCQTSGNCTDEQVALQAQDFCGGFCMGSLGVSCYPDMNATEPFNTGGYPCGNFKAPIMLEPAVCEPFGDVEKAVEVKEMNLTKLNSDTTSGGKSFFKSWLVALFLAGALTSCSF